MNSNIAIVPWDTKLFNKNVFEIVYNPNLTANDYIKIDRECCSNAYYSYVKINSEDIEAIHTLEKLGFNYIESQCKLKNVMKKEYDIRHYNKVFKLSVVNEIDTEDIKSICNIAKTTFDSDRYYMDPLIDNKISGERYNNWILSSFKDEYYNLYKYSYRKTNEIVSFYMTRNTTDGIYLALQGLAPSMKGKGISLSMLIDYFNACFNEGNKLFYTMISGINIDALNEHLSLGFKVVDNQIVLRKFY